MRNRLNRDREYAVTFAVRAAPHEATRLRTLLRDTLELGGFEVTVGATIIESAVLEAVAGLQTQRQMREPGYEPEHQA